MEMSTKNKVIFSVLVTINQVCCFITHDIPQIPSGKRTQFYLQNQDGAYKYGYDTGSSFAKQSGDSNNQVEGHYAYEDPRGHQIDLKYTSGVQGFVPIGVDHIPAPSLPIPQVYHYHVPIVAYQTFETAQGVPNPDGSYSFSYSTDDQARHESSDASGNIQGDYWYINHAGKHDLSYVAGASTGFQPTGGNLAGPVAVPNAPAGTYGASGGNQDDQSDTGDASYSFGFNTNEYQRQESSDSKGNVKGRYSYTNKDGTHDLSYVAGSKTGFMPTGGNLAPVGTGSSTNFGASSGEYQGSAGSGDASYSFTIDTDEYKRKESSDASGNVQGTYSYTNKDGTHDLTYKAGSQTGFVATSGSLSVPNGIPSARFGPKSHGPAQSSHESAETSHGPSQSSQTTPGDGSYSFTIDTSDYQRQEMSDASGNVKGSYSYRNDAGQHDLSYVAGASTGFQATGGSLKEAPGVVPLQAVEMGHGHEVTKMEDEVLLKTFLPPGEERKKFGYVLETKY